MSDTDDKSGTLSESPLEETCTCGAELLGNVKWKDIAVCDDKETITEYMEYLKMKNPKNEYRIEK